MNNNVDAVKRFKVQATKFGQYVFEHWITLIVLVVSATQTYFLVSQFAPAFAFWLPALGVCLMEGGFLYWRWREYEADISDGSLEDVTKNEQERIANVMVYITLISSVVTMLAGAFIEIAQSDLSTLLAIPEIANTFGLVAIICIFLLAGVHMYCDWQYRRADPDAKIEREYRASERSLKRQERQAELDGRGIISKGKVNQLRQQYADNGERIGRETANSEFTRQYAAKADDENPTPPSTRQ